MDCNTPTVEKCELYKESGVWLGTCPLRTADAVHVDYVVNRVWVGTQLKMIFFMNTSKTYIWLILSKEKNYFVCSPPACVSRMQSTTVITPLQSFTHTVIFSNLRVLFES